MAVPEYPSEEILERVRGSISRDEVLAQLERICRSEVFENQGNAKKVLRYLVMQALERAVPSPREIASEALGYEYFARGDSIVRATMKTLRAKLSEYYTTEAKDDEIWLDIPERQYSVFWRHSPKTLLGQTEFGGWVLWSSKLTEEDAKRAAATSRKFWPHLSAVFPVYCAEAFPAELHGGVIILPDGVKMFFDSIGNCHLFITSFDRSEIRIYPLNVWLEEWARAKSSETGTTGLAVFEHWGQSAEIENKTQISLHPKLLNALNLPENEPFEMKLHFHPDGFIYFNVPPPPPRPKGKYNLYGISYAPVDGQKFYFFVMVSLDKDKDFKQALSGTSPFNLKAYGSVIASGDGDPPDGMKERLLAKYAPVIAGALSEPGHHPGSS